MKLLEKAIALVSPQWAFKRSMYIDGLRSYEAGEINRFNGGWTPINADTENTDKTQRDLIKARARYLEDNSDIAMAAVSGIVRNVVGTGILLAPFPDKRCYRPRCQGSGAKQQQSDEP